MPRLVVTLSPSMRQWTLLLPLPMIILGMLKPNPNPLKTTIHVPPKTPTTVPLTRRNINPITKSMLSTKHNLVQPSQTRNLTPILTHYAQSVSIIIQLTPHAVFTPNVTITVTLLILFVCHLVPKLSPNGQFHLLNHV